jgi:very-short-patch-repair endonuclease
MSYARRVDGMTDLEAAMLYNLRVAGLPEPEREYKFHPTRKWRFDFAYPERKIAIEAEGGVWTNGGHNRGKIYTSNCEKYNAAALMGWCVLRYTTDMIAAGDVARDITELINRNLPIIEKSGKLRIEGIDRRT